MEILINLSSVQFREKLIKRHAIFNSNNLLRSLVFATDNNPIRSLEIPFQFQIFIRFIECSLVTYSGTLSSEDLKDQGHIIIWGKQLEARKRHVRN